MRAVRSAVFGVPPDKDPPTTPEMFRSVMVVVPKYKIDRTRQAAESYMGEGDPVALCLRFGRSVQRRRMKGQSHPREVGVSFRACGQDDGP